MRLQLLLIQAQNALTPGFSVSYSLGLARPHGIELKIDLLSALLATLVSGMGFMVTLFSRQGVDERSHPIAGASSGRCGSSPSPACSASSSPEMRLTSMCCWRSRR